MSASPSGLFRRLHRGMWWDRAWQLTEGCTPVSPGCDNCWSARASHMRASNPNATIAARHAGLTLSTGKWAGVVRMRQDNLNLPLTVKTPSVFAVWNDLFHRSLVVLQPKPTTSEIRLNEAGFQFLCEAFAVMRECPQHVFIVLTKRARLAAQIVPKIMAKLNMSAPLPNVVGMVTAEDQQRADERVPLLLQTLWAVRGVSYEPALGPVNFAAAGGLWADMNNNVVRNGSALGRALDWIIMGGESGPGARPMHPDWARKTRDDCAAAGVAFMFKQWGEWQDGSAPGRRQELVVLTDGSAYTEQQVAQRQVDEKHHGSPGFWGPGLNPCIMARVGKAQAGRLLDGREHLEVPRITTSAREAR